MAARAFVLLKLEPNRTVDAQQKLADLPGVRSFASTTGRFDSILTIEESDYPQLSKFVISKIREIPGVRDTETLFIIE